VRLVAVPERVVTPRTKGFISLESHPIGCATTAARLVETASKEAGPTLGPVLVIGSSTGYGLATTAVSAFGYGAPTLGVCLERPAERGRTASAGWYNVAAVHAEARRRGANVITINGDCFAKETKEAVIEQVKALGGVELLVYSVAAPVRIDPDAGITHRSVIKPITGSLRAKGLSLDTGRLVETTLEPASHEEIEATTKVMGGEDWARWVRVLGDAGVLAPEFRTVAYTYLGSSLTSPIYRSGTIGRAKEHLEHTAQLLGRRDGIEAFTSVNGALVTQASAAIPSVGLYMSLLFAATRDLGAVVESGLRQIQHLFGEHLGPGRSPTTDDDGRIRLDRWELSPPLQSELERRWNQVSDDNLEQLADVPRFRREFLNLFGFDVEGVDYQEPVALDVAW
jgi:enoyl-[acyl-carrier protein] reductase / trans-2-enoyl-CoA reductase (NAD+)